VLRNYRDLKVWDKSYHLCLDFYRLSKKFPLDERYGLSLQMRRSVVSIPSNIAEGYGRKSKKEYIHFLYEAYGSYCEFETQLLLASDLNYIKTEQFEKI